MPCYKKMTQKQRKAFFATKGFKRKPRKKRKK